LRQAPDGAITRDVLRCVAASGATPLRVADGIVRARIIRRAWRRSTKAPRRRL
jgi:hypothetical protein